MNRSYYEILGVRRDATLEEIKKAYRRKALENHPDHNAGNQEADVRFREILEAYRILSDEDKRRQFDLQGRVSGRRGRRETVWSSTAEGFFHQTFRRAGHEDRSHAHAHRPRAEPGQHRDLVVEITLEEAAGGLVKDVWFPRRDLCDDCSGTGARHGTAPIPCTYCDGRREVVQSRGYYREITTCPSCHGKGVKISDPCPRCDGKGQVPSEGHVLVEIPAGVESGHTIELPNEGEPGDPGAPRGNLRIQVGIKRHPFFVRRHNDLVCRVPISFPQAVLGGEIEVPTLTEPERLTVPPGTQSGEVLKLRGRGMPDPGGGRGRGDELVEVVVETPTGLAPDQLAMIRELAPELERPEISPKRRDYEQTLRANYLPVTAPVQETT